jgi:tRNA splicing endonuclease
MDSQITAVNSKTGVTVSWHVFRSTDTDIESKMTNVVYDMLRGQGFDVKDITVGEDQ